MSWAKVETLLLSRYVEVSAKTGDGISDMFQSLTKSMMSTWESWHSSDLHLRSKSSKRSSMMMTIPMKRQSTPPDVGQSSSRPKKSTSTGSRSSLMFLQTRSETLRASFRWRKNNKKKTKKEDTNQEIEGEDVEMVEEVMVVLPAASTKTDAAASPEIVTKKPHTKKIFCCMS